jgi:hypothetical protein
MWKMMRDGLKLPIISSWIHESGNGETASFSDLWVRIESEVRQCDALLLHVYPEDFPLKGAFVEVGMALALGKKIFVSRREVHLEERSCRPLGSWVNHPSVWLGSQTDGLEKVIHMALGEEELYPPAEPELACELVSRDCEDAENCAGKAEGDTLSPFLRCTECGKISTWKQ